MFLQAKSLHFFPLLLSTEGKKMKERKENFAQLLVYNPDPVFQSKC